MTFCYTHRSVSCPVTLEQLPHTADGNEYRVLQPDVMLKVSQLEVSTEFLLLKIRESSGRGEEKSNTVWKLEMSQINGSTVVIKGVM